ncbi:MULTISPECIES: cellulose biosynthesis protein BcsC [unclassified Variovorax]|uniref:cellulose biosynthesis protein BcsC n=1 Tax=unclassified Variovorax TaxID=663243 RepID=UPI000F7EF509|nr:MULTISPECIES: cellulose biosynthesis protein BcsC [unclassified Variovorax]RSZ30397.1 tetratricopeptide repeat protein [Variovorax sp. 553]RSZ30933.1 tetratricopeptide repeat protein [Variovorax sp. 679]
MPSQSTGLKPGRHLSLARASVAARPFALSPQSRQWMACFGMLAALCAGNPAQAQVDAGAALTEQGNYWQAQGRAELAEESWKKLLSIQPQSTDAMYGMAQVELSRGNTEAARGWIARLRSASPNDARLARLQQQAQQPGGGQSTLQRARAAARAGRAAEAVELYRSQFDNRPPPEALALEFYQVLASTPQGADEGRRGLEQLVKDHPDNANYRLALAQQKTYSESTRRAGIRELVELTKQPAVATAARAAWRQALIWLDARQPDVALYQEYLGSNQNDAAVAARLDTLTKAKTAAANTPGVPVGEGFQALDRGDPATAEQRFQQALRTKPDDSEALGGLGLVRLRQERFAEAQELLERAARGGGSKWNSALQSATYWTLVGQARAAQSKNDARGAQSLYERAVRIDPREPVGQNALADLRAAAGDYAQAEQGYKRVLESKPQNTQALNGLISLYGATGRPDEALALSRRLTPEQATQLGGLRNLQVDQARNRARQQADAGDAAGAQRTLEDAMLAAPDSPWVRLDLANIYRKQGLVSEARGVMEGLLMSQPDMPDALYASALLASETGDAAAGIQYLERIPAGSRTRDMAALQRRLWAQSQAARALALARQGQADAARGVLAQAEATLGADMPAELWGQLAGAYAEIGDAPRALAMSRQLLARTPVPSTGDRLLYASVLLKTKQDIELSAVLRQLAGTSMTASQRNDFDSLRIAFALRQTDALREAGNLEAAYNAMAPVLAERPEDPQVLAALARLYSAARDEGQALGLYQRILQRSPTDLDTLLAAAASASAQREHSQAENYVMAALKQAPDQSRVLAAAGRVYRNAGESRKAEQYLRAALEAERQVASGGFAPGGVPMQQMPSANPFAGMTGGAPGAAVPAGALPANGNPFAQVRMQPAVYPAAAGAATYPAGYPAASAYPAAQQQAYPGYPVAAAPAAYPPGALPWGSTAPAASGAKGRQPTAKTSTRTARNNATGNVPQTSAYIAPSMQPVPQYPVPGSGQVAPVYIPQAAAPAGYPAYPQANAAYAQANTARPEPSWNAPLRSAPASSLASEVQELESQRAISLTAGTVYRNRAGEAGLSRLSDFQLPVQARFPVGEGKIVVGVTPTVLDAGTPASDYPTGSRFGGGPAAALNALSTGASAGQQNASGVGLNVGYEGKNFEAGIGTTPLGFPTTNVVGNVTFKGSFGDSWNYKADVSRRAVTDSVLSFAGAKDERTNERWGGVVATGVRGDIGYDDGTYGVYSYLAAHGITGKNVASNSRVETGGGAYLHLLNNPNSKLTLGMNIGLMGYEKNLSYYTFGQGGYFSPQSFVSVAFPVDWSGRSDRLSWRLNASLGVQSFNQKASPYFPTDASRNSAASTAAYQALALGLSSSAYNNMYAGSSKTGLAYNLAAVLEYQLAPKMFLGGALGFNNAQNYRQFTGSVYLRYVFGGSNSIGVPGYDGGGATLRPMTSPYTPLL